MSSPKPEQRIYKPFFMICRFFWKITHRRQPVLGMENIGELPAVFVGRHQNLYGPVEIIAWAPMQFRVWTLYKFMTFRDCYRHYATDTFQRMGFSPVGAKMRAAATAPLVSAFMRSMAGIPVFRGRKNIIDTFRQSVDALCGGQSLLVMPERDYLDDGSDAGELYTGFVHIAQLFHKATGKALSFYPVYPSRENGAIYVEKPIVFDPGKPFRAERERIVEALKKELSHRAIEQDFDIRVVDSADRG